MTETMADYPLDKATATATILRRCVCVVLTCSKLGNGRRVDLSQFDMKDHRTGEEVADEKSEVTGRKQLLDAEELKASRQVIEMAKSYMRSIAIQGHRVFGPGTYLVPNLLVLQMEERLKQHVADLAVAVDALVARYPEAVEKRKAKLGKFFNIRDYLSPEEVRSEFALDWNYVSFSAPEQLEDVDRAVYEAAVAKHSQQLSTAYDEVVEQLRAGALQVMRDLVERLKPGADGKPKALRGTALRDLQDFVALLPKRDITGDAELGAVVAKVAAYAEGLDVGVLKSAPAVRAGLLAAAAEAAGELDRLVASRPARSFSFGGA